MINFLHTYQPNSVLVDFGLVKIYWYGLFMMLAIVIGIAVFWFLGRSKKINLEVAIDYAFWLVICGLVSARLYYLILEFNYYYRQPGEMIKVWHGGLAIHGAIIGGAIAIYYFANKKGFKVFDLLALTSVSLAIGQAIGRLGNYFNQELYGRETTLPWGIPITKIGLEGIKKIYVQPTFLYESLLDVVLFIILFSCYLAKVEARKIFSFYLLGYGVIRLAMEFLRVDNPVVVWGLNWPQIISLIFIIIAIVLLTSPKKIWEEKK